MSRVGSRWRSYKSIEIDDLKKLAKIARQDHKNFFQRHPKWAKLYSQRKVCIALCQGAAKHYIDNDTGINDFDIYTFYKTHHQKHWYAKRRKFYDLGYPKFGKSKDRPTFIGRRVDSLGRGIEVNDGENIVIALRRYLQHGKTETARHLAAKAVILLEPNCGTIVWPDSEIVKNYA